jgi:hypothetical protein
MVIISVIRNFEMYHRLVRDNRYNGGAVFYPIDNREKNEGVSVCYNRFLDQFDYSKEDWFVFCHEDWEIQEDWAARFDRLDKASLYGPVGVRVVGGMRIVLGQIKNSSKDGSGLRLLGNFVKTGALVETFDCQCVIVHSSLILRTGLRFDPKLSFDLYVEDFCMQARENHGISSRVFALKCQHYSFGNLGPRFFSAAEYIRRKYPNLKICYSSTATKVLIGKINLLDIFCVEREVVFLVLLRYVYQSKITRSGHRLTKIFKIPVYRKKVEEIVQEDTF